MSLSRTEAKITVAKFIEVAYSKDKGLTKKIFAKNGRVKLTVDENGNATLSGSAGIMTFSGKSVLEKVGVTIKRVSVNFENKAGMEVGYTASFNLEIITLSVNGAFDLEKLILSCSGLLCIAARALKRRHPPYDAELKQIMR